MAKCFCGCERSIPFSMRPVNTRGKRVLRDVARVQRLRATIPYSPTLDEYIDDGMTVAVAIAQAVHDGGRPDDRLEQGSAGWRAAGRHYTTGGLGKAVRKSGLTVDEAVAGMQAGTYDPFAVR